MCRGRPQPGGGGEGYDGAAGGDLDRGRGDQEPASAPAHRTHQPVLHGGDQPPAPADPADTADGADTPAQVADTQAQVVPASSVAYTPAQVVADTPAQVVADTPAQVVADTPAQEVAYTPAHVVADTPAQVVADTPA